VGVWQDVLLGRSRPDQHGRVLSAFWRQTAQGQPLVRLASIVPWAHIEEIYIQNLSEAAGRPALSSRIAFWVIFIKEYDRLTDEKTVENI